jgi:hypothetical protein
MWEFRRLHYAGLLAGVDSGTTSEEKGAALENLMEYLFGLVPGLSIDAKDRRTDAEELDLVLFNERSHPVLVPWEPVILVECKNWSGPLPARDVVVFVNELRRRHLQNGILVAKNGISGNQYRDAGRMIFEALHEGFRVVVLTGNQLEQVDGRDSFIQLLKNKYCGIFVGNF